MKDDYQVMNQPELSILLPNRGHMDYARETIRNILSIEDSRIELIINDNSLPEKLDYSEFLQDRRVRYFHENEVLPMSENWAQAARRATGKWIVFIGADDGLFPQNIPKFLDILEKLDSDVLLTRSGIFSYQIGDVDPYIETPLNPTKRTVSEIGFWFRCAALFFTLRNPFLPMPYHRGVVRRSVINDLILQSKKIPSISPDDFLGQFIAQKCRSGLYLDEVIFIEGISDRSNGRSVAHNRENPHWTEFVQDSRPLLMGFMRGRSLECWPALAIEHFLEARRWQINRVSFVPKQFLKMWCSFSCFDVGHHGGFLFAHSRLTRRFLLNILLRSLRKAWTVRYFGLYNPFKNKRTYLPKGSTIFDAALKHLDTNPIQDEKTGRE